jgi:Ca-activated chloride channel homolog
MIEHAWPWLALALPLPLLLRWLLKPRATAVLGGLRAPFAARLAQPPGAAAASSRWCAVLAWLAWVLLVLAATRPQWIGEEIEQPLTGRDLLLAIDTSGSMQVQDMQIGGAQVDRLTALKEIASEFIERRVGDRIGLILFGSNAYLQAPITVDRATVNELLDQSVIGIAGKDTAIGDAIGLALKRLRELDATERVLLLMTDGANTAGELEPRRAAELARDLGVKIYTIGIGADSMTIDSFFGSRQVNPSADLDEGALTDIATTTGGRYFRARDTQDLRKIYAEIDRLEPRAKPDANYRPVTELYALPLAVALLLVGLIGGWRRA